LPVLRTQFLESLALFDFPDPGLIVAERPTTNVPAQALYLLNNPFVIRQAEAATDTLLAGDSCDCERVRRAYLSVLGRIPTVAEVAAAEAFLESYAGSTETNEAAGVARRAAWVAFYQALFGSADFLYRS